MAEKESKIVIVLNDAADGEPIRVTSSPTGSGAIRILPRDKRGEPIDLWLDGLEAAIDEVRKFDDED
jgi:hypothetical protein